MRKMQYIILFLLIVLFPGAGAEAEMAEDLRTVTLPNSVETVESEAFAGSGMKTLVIASGVKTVQSRAFADCARLEDVMLPLHDVAIAEDAFAGCGEIYFHAFAGSKNELWALSHGYRCESMDANVLQQASAMLTRFGIPSSSLYGDDKKFITCCLIVKMEAGTDHLPNISQFGPTEIVQAGKNRFFIQFDSPADTRSCYHLLTENLAAYHIQFVEADQYLDMIDEGVASQQSVVSGWNSVDPMGFSQYSQFVKEETTQNARIAVLDSGFPANSAYSAKLLSSLGISFSRDGNPWNYDGCDHGRVVAAVLADCIGTAPVKLIPVRVTDSRGRVDTISLILGLEYAQQQGADFVNLSLGFEQANFNSEALTDTINGLSATVVAAAGNYGGKSCLNYFPAKLSSVVSVGAANPGGELAAYSCVDAMYAAPGSVSALGISEEGTSFAAPQIAAALALLKLDPNHSAEELRATCDPVSGITFGMPRLDRLAKRSVVSVKLNGVPDQLALGIDDYFQVAYTLLPHNADNQAVDFETSDASVLRVTKNSSGLVLAMAAKPGQAVLTVRSQDDPNIFDSHTVTVVQPVTSISITNAPDSIYMTESVALNGLCSPADASNKKLTWSSSDSAVAAISSSGVITPKKEGTVTFTATAMDGFGASASCTVTIEKRPLVMSITVTAPNGESQADVGSALQLTAVVEPALAEQRVQWESLFPDVASIDENGLAEFLSPGIAVFLANSTDGSGKKGSISITAVDYCQVTLNVNTSDGKPTLNPSAITVTRGTAIGTLPTPERAGFEFLGWYSASSGGNEITASTVISNDTVIYAHWRVETYYVSYNANGGTGAPMQQVKLGGTALTLSNTIPQRSYKITVNDGGANFTPVTVSADFIVWNTKADGSGNDYAPGASYTQEASATLYAQWMDAVVGSLIVPPHDPGYIFVGFFTAPTGGTEIMANTVVTEDITIYTRWQEDEEYLMPVILMQPEDYVITLDGVKEIMTDIRDEQIVFSVDALNTVSYQWQTNKTGVWIDMEEGTDGTGTKTNCFSPRLNSTFLLNYKNQLLGNREPVEYRCVLTSATGKTVTTEAAKCVEQ